MRAQRAQNAAQHLPRERGRPGTTGSVIFTLWCEGHLCRCQLACRKPGFADEIQTWGCLAGWGLRLLREPGAALVCSGSERGRVPQLFGQVSPGASHGPGSLPSLLGRLTRLPAGAWPTRGATVADPSSGCARGPRFQLQEIPERPSEGCGGNGHAGAPLESSHRPRAGGGACWCKVGQRGHQNPV